MKTLHFQPLSVAHRRAPLARVRSAARRNLVAIWIVLLATGVVVTGAVALLVTWAP
jgi:hypothetical protein